MGSALPYSGGTGIISMYLFPNWPYLECSQIVAASSRSYFGRKGYLATITSQGENDFIWHKTSGVGWIGAEDIGRRNGEPITDPGTGDWRWVTGPEGMEDSGNGLEFWNGYTSGSSVGVHIKTVKSGESSNFGGAEYIAHIFNTDGLWHDFSPTNDFCYQDSRRIQLNPNDHIGIQISSTKTNCRDEACFYKHSISSVQPMNYPDTIHS